jgi:hypothetical protein
MVQNIKKSFNMSAIWKRVAITQHKNNLVNIFENGSLKLQDFFLAIRQCLCIFATEIP